MMLEKYLSPGARYIPCDVVSRDERTVVVDLNTQDMPDFGVPALGAIGLIVYLFDVSKFLAQAARQFTSAVITYVPTDTHPDTETRLGHAWVNHLSQAEVEAMIRAAGFTIMETRQIEFGQVMWHLQKTPDYAAALRFL